MDYPLSNTDITRLLPGINIVFYKDLAKYNNLFELVNNKYFASIILYPAKSDFNGHWVCLFLNHRGGLEFFDPYGYNIDSEFEHTEVQHPRYLSKLFLHAKQHGVTIEYNQHRIQKHDPTIATCGKHVVNRIKHRLMTTDQYFKRFGGSNADLIVHRIIMNSRGAPSPTAKGGGGRGYCLFNIC